MHWDQKQTKELMAEGLSWEHARIAVGFIAENRQIAYMEGYNRGFQSGTKEAMRIMVKMIKKLMDFPYPKICRHAVAADILSILESNGVAVSDELARAVVMCHDDTALQLLEEIKL